MVNGRRFASRCGSDDEAIPKAKAKAAGCASASARQSRPHARFAVSPRPYARAGGSRRLSRPIRRRKPGRVGGPRPRGASRGPRPPQGRCARPPTPGARPRSGQRSGLSGLMSLRKLGLAACGGQSKGSFRRGLNLTLSCIGHIDHFGRARKSQISPINNPTYGWFIDNHLVRCKSSYNASAAPRPLDEDGDRTCLLVSGEAEVIRGSIIHDRANKVRGLRPTGDRKPKEKCRERDDRNGF